VAYFNVESGITFEIMKKIMEISVWTGGNPSTILTIQVYCATLLPYQIPPKAKGYVVTAVVWRWLCYNNV
jgi:hypothetical protein